MESCQQESQLATPTRPLENQHTSRSAHCYPGVYEETGVLNIHHTQLSPTLFRNLFTEVEKLHLKFKAPCATFHFNLPQWVDIDMEVSSGLFHLK